MAGFKSASFLKFELLVVIVSANDNPAVKQRTLKVLKTGIPCSQRQSFAVNFTHVHFLPLE